MDERKRKENNKNDTRTCVRRNSRNKIIIKRHSNGFSHQNNNRFPLSISSFWPEVNISCQKEHFLSLSISFVFIACFALYFDWLQDDRREREIFNEIKCEKIWKKFLKQISSSPFSFGRQLQLLTVLRQIRSKKDEDESERANKERQKKTKWAKTFRSR